MTGKVVESLDFAAIICSRLCHDLVGPIGAVNNGLSIIEDEDDPEMAAAAMAIIVESVGQAMARLKFFRLAFGASGEEAVVMAASEAAELAQQYFAGGRISLFWNDPKWPSEEWPQNAAKLVLNLVLVMAESLPRGGTISIFAIREAGLAGFRVDAAGTSAVMKEEIVDIMGGSVRSVSAHDAKHAPAVLATELARALSTMITFQSGPDTVSAKILLKDLTDQGG